MSSSTTTLKEHPATCTWCEQGFVITQRSQLAALNSGRNVFCRKSCAGAYSNNQAKDRYLLGPCPGCGKMFRSCTKGKKYCTIDCYCHSPETTERLRQLNKDISLPAGECPNCGKDCPKNRKYCCTDCQREFFAARFDRWIANPEKIALPQNFDEFMLQNELPCLVEGCDFVGENLASHVNKVHGITADAFREMVGFNKRTGLVGRGQRKRMSERLKAMVAAGVITQNPDHLLNADRSSRESPRLEGVEHIKKSRALIVAAGPLRPARPCRQCSEPVPQPTLGRREYCSTRCRSRYYREQGSAELLCDFCGAAFMGMLEQVKRVREGKKVCCSLDCRNKMNIVGALAARGIEYTPS